MDFKNTLTLKLTGIIATSILAFSLVIFMFSKSYFENNFEKTLKDKTFKIVDVLLDTNKNEALFIKNKFKDNIFSLSNQSILVLNDLKEIQFEENSIDKDLKIKLLGELQNKDSFSILKDDTLYIAFNYIFKNKTYQVITSAIDLNALWKLKYLKIGLLIFLLTCIAFTYLAGIIFAKKTLEPINHIIRQVEKLNEISLNERLKTRNGKDEIAMLAITFNQLLDRIENSFKLQKSFVSNASHEFRTPLTVMKGQIEVLLLQPRSNEKYLSTFISLLEDINNQINLINGLADLANANAMFPNIITTNVSIIELLDECVSELYKNKKYHVVLNIEELPEDENTLYLKGNNALLKSALINVMDNACKFSTSNTCQVNLICNPEFIEITVIDKGLGINKVDLPNIFESFYRSNNTRHIQGHGIGLSLVKKIVEFYHGKITVASEIGKGTKMSIFFPNVNSSSYLKF